MDTGSILTEKELEKNALWLVNDLRVEIERAKIKGKPNVVIAVYRNAPEPNGSPSAHFVIQDGYDNTDILDSIGDVLNTVGVQPAALYAIQLIRPHNNPVMAISGIGIFNGIRTRIDVGLAEDGDFYVYGGITTNYGVGNDIPLPDQSLEQIVFSFKIARMSAALSSGFLAAFGNDKSS